MPRGQPPLKHIAFASRQGFSTKYVDSGRSAPQKTAVSADEDKRTNAFSAPEPGNEPRSRPEFKSLHSGRDQPGWAAVMRFEDEAVDGRSAHSARCPTTWRRGDTRPKATVGEGSWWLLSATADRNWRRVLA